MSADASTSPCGSIVKKLEVWAKLGEKKYPDGSRSIGHVPHRGKESYLHHVYPGLSTTEMTEVEAQINTSIPLALRSFYLCLNGINLFNDALYFYGLRRHFSRNISDAPQPYSIVTPNRHERPRSLPDAWVVIGGYGFDGTSIVSNPEGALFHIDGTNEDRPLRIHIDVFQFIRNEIDRISALYTEIGDVTVSRALTAHSKTI